MSIEEFGLTAAGETVQRVRLAGGAASAPGCDSATDGRRLPMSASVSSATREC